jgi:ankyrin repeat protein
MVKLLLAVGVNVNTQDEYGRTAFELAIKLEHTGVADLLRHHRATE